MVRTESQSNVSLNEQVYIGDDMVMSLTANIEISKPEEISYSPVIVNIKKYFEHLNEMSEAQRNFEDRVLQKQQELINERNKEEFYETEI